ncbi:MAG: hypothetical protein GY862_01185 [Gammaproteobacteria bacterium]|nr:hypothetical protein [Gammaproteobacteria bacterium]
MPISRNYEPSLICPKSNSEAILADGGDIRADTTGFGKAGNVSLSVDKLILKNGAQINVSTGNKKNVSGKGDGGTIRITAGKGVWIEGRSGKMRSGLLNNVFTEGQGGAIKITSPVVEIQDGGTIQAGTEGKGNAGVIALEVDELRITGRAGNIEITASKSVELSDPADAADEDGEDIGVQGNISNPTFGDGDAGRIRIHTPLLTLRQGAKIVSLTKGTGQGGEGVQKFIFAKSAKRACGASHRRKNKFLHSRSLPPQNSI